MRSVTHFLLYSSPKCSRLLQFSRRLLAPLLRLSSPQRRTGKLEKKLFLSCGRFKSLPVVFSNSKTRRHSEIKQTRPSTKQDFSGEASSKQKTEASLASLSCNSSRAPTEWSAIFAFGAFFIWLPVAISGADLGGGCRGRKFSNLGVLPDFIPWGTRYESVNYGISNYWFTWSERAHRDSQNPQVWC